MKDLISCDLIRAATLSEGETKAWSLQQINEAVERYQKYFALMTEHVDTCMAPTQDIDAIWHLHMQSPCAYSRDCLDACGQLIDHDGGFGHTEEELPRLIEVFEATSTIWAERYGEPYLQPSDSGSAKKCWHNCQSRCHNACKSMAVHA